MQHQYSIKMKIYILKKSVCFYFILFAFSILIFSSCKKTDNYNSAAISEYYPLQTGKFITYQLDSLIYLAFGTRDTTVSYQVKYLTDAQITDNLGRPAYRIFRYIRKDATAMWMPDATFMVVNTINNLEFIENNLRYIKLQLPIKNDISWKGNSYIDTYSSFSLLKYLENWDYTYSNVAGSDVVGNYQLDSTVTVNQRDEIIGIPSEPTSYSEVNFGQEKYAKGIGMVYRKFFHSEYQPNNGGYFADGSYGVTYTMIDHN